MATEDTSTLKEKEKEGTTIIQHTDVQDYYGKTLSSSADLKTNACCTKSNICGLTDRIKAALSNINTEVTKRYYGCGLVFPEAIEGRRILDLGCGAGRDCFVLSQLVGREGFVIGVDMTKEQIDVAKQHVSYHGDKFGYCNVSFVEGLIEDLMNLGIEKESIDVIISNCVINLCPNKTAVLKASFDILKNGGEMYFSDIYSDCPLTNEAKNNKILQGECIGGALEWRELISLAEEIGFAPPILVDVSEVTLNDSFELKDLLGDTKFCSATYRLYKVPPLSPSLTSTTDEVTYNGTIPDHMNELKFSYEITFKKGTTMCLHPSLSHLLKNSRLREHFTFTVPSSSSPQIGTYTNSSCNPFECMSEKSSLECCSNERGVKPKCC